MKRIWISLTSIIWVLTFGCLGETQEISALNRVGSEVQQAILVHPLKYESFRAEVSLWERHGERWKQIGPVLPAVIGRSGLALKDTKREGDGRTPHGVFSIYRAFGYHPNIKTKIDYRMTTEKDLWIDDPASADYNRWVKAPTSAVSYEILRREDFLYEYAAVIEYNTDPIVPGKGSAIFLHVWRSSEIPTAGCVALSKENVVKILEWLDKSKNPVIVNAYKPEHWKE